MEDIKTMAAAIKENIKVFLKWTILACFIGCIVGFIGTSFYHAMDFATSFRKGHDFMLYLLPLAGIVIIFMYRSCGIYQSRGTNLILLSIRSGEKIPLKVFPLIYISTIITHFFGGSCGREGAALQIGGSIGNFVGNIIKLNEEDKKIIIMCAMSACFSSVFGTPMAAAIFSLEVSNVGILYYAALFPCVIASIIGAFIARHLGAMPEVFHVPIIPDFDSVNLLKIIVIGLILAVASILFCIVLHSFTHLFQRFIKNPYIRVFTGGCVIILLTLVLGTRDYLGAGMDVIERAFEGEVRPEAFLLKMLFTGITLAVGFKGGEIVPSFFIGATLGAFLGPIFGLPAALCAACGMVGIFCGVTNSPITSLLLSFELFGIGDVPYYMIVIAITYMMSGHYSLYHSQKILYGKLRPVYINADTK